jgi:hypothetical protein
MDGLTSGKYESGFIDRGGNAVFTAEGFVQLLQGLIGVLLRTVRRIVEDLQVLFVGTRRTLLTLHVVGYAMRKWLVGKRSLR